MIQVYLDMDGVIANFRKKWLELVRQGYDKHGIMELSLREATLDHKIYRGLELMPGTDDLIQFLKSLEDHKLAKIQLLTSAHTFKVDQYYECRAQKQAWLDEHGIIWPMILTNCGEEKACWARSKDCILIDDTVHNCQFFGEEGGVGYIYDPRSTTFSLDDLKEVIRSMV